MNAKTKGVVLITGASSGIGRACALRLARAGYAVFGTTRRSPAEVAIELRAELPPEAALEILGMDVDDEATVTAAIAEIVSQTARLDAIVPCAGFGIAGAVEDTSDEEARAILETNFLGTVRVCRAALPIMRRQGSGRIVILSSIGGRIGLPFQGFYSASKFALEGLAEALRMEVRRFGVHVVLIEPGDFCTGFTDNRRPTRAAVEVKTYQSARDRVLSIVENDERHGAPPQAVGRLVERILTMRSPRVRYTVGAPPQRLAVGLKRVLPSKLFEWALSNYYHVG